MVDAAQRQGMGSFRLSLNLTDRRGLEITGVVYSDDTPAELNLRIDMMQDVLERQAVRCDITTKEAQIAAHVQNLELMREQMEALVAKKREGIKMTSTEKQAIDGYDTQVKRATDMIEGLRAAIVKAKEKYGFE